MSKRAYLVQIFDYRPNYEPGIDEEDGLETITKETTLKTFLNQKKAEKYQEYLRKAINEMGLQYKYGISTLIMGIS